MKIIILFICTVKLLFAINPFLGKDPNYNPILKSPCATVFENVIINNPDILDEKMKNLNKVVGSLYSNWNIKGFRKFKEEDFVAGDKNLLVLGHEGATYAIDLMMKQKKKGVFENKNNIHVVFPESYEEISIDRTFALLNFIDALHSGIIKEAVKYFSEQNLFFNELISFPLLTEVFKGRDLNELESFLLDILSLLTFNGNMRFLNTNLNPSLLHVLNKLKAEKKLDYVFIESEKLLLIRKIVKLRLLSSAK